MNNLKQTVKGLLNEKGLLDKIKAEIRAEIFRTLENGKEMGIKIENNENKYENSEDDLIINEMIVEYLNHKGLNHTLSVFISEAKSVNSNKIKPQLTINKGKHKTILNKLIADTKK